MKPYYQDEYVTLYCGDCMEIVPTLGQFDLLLTDPPYGINYVHGGGGGSMAKSTSFGGVAVYGDDSDFNPLKWILFDKVVLWGANHFAQKLPKSAGWLVWDKRDGMKGNDQSDCEIAWTNWMSTARIHRQAWNGMITTGEQKGKSRFHPTQKPVELMTWCITLAGDGVKTILDPFAGSGTTGVAAKLLNRKCTLIEKEEKYCEIAARRLSIDEECNATINGMGALLRGGQGGTRQAVCLMDQGGSVMSIEEEKAGTLLAHRNNPVICYENHAQDSRIKDCGELSPSISAKAGTGGGNLPLVQEVSDRPKFWNGNEYAECLTAKSADDRMPDKGRLPCVIEPALHGVFSSGAGSSAGSIAFSETTSPTLKSVQSGNMAPSVHLGSQVRRLTPKECERLQGFPDDWTRISWRGKLPEDCPDGPRYKACGNSMAVPVMRWIGERIDKQEKEQK